MRLIDADAMRQDWLENGENEYIYDANAVLDSIDAQPTVSRWIPVTERLPEKSCESILVFVSFFTCRSFTYENVVVMAYYCKYGFVCERFGEILYGVTHWMPLPDAPEEVHRENTHYRYGS